MMRRRDDWQTAVVDAHHRLIVNGVAVGDVLDFDDQRYTIRRMGVAAMVSRAFRAGRHSTGERPLGAVVYDGGEVIR